MEKVIMYSTGCPKCRQLEKRLNQRGIKFTVEEDRDKILAKGIKDIPALEVGGQLLDFAHAWQWATTYIEVTG